MYTQKIPPETAFDTARALKQYDSYISYLLANNRKLRISNLLSYSCLLLSILFLAWAAKLPKAEPLVITVTDTGKAAYVGKLNGKGLEQYSRDNFIIDKMLREYVTDSREFGTDPDFLNSNYLQAMAYLDNNERIKLNNEINAASPFDHIGEYVITVHIETVMMVSKNTYQVDWLETKKDLFGNIQDNRKMRGTFTIRQVRGGDYEKLSEKEKKLNPLGIYITYYEIVPVDQYSE